MTRARAAAATALVLLCGAAPASAAYDPRLSVHLDPPRPAAPAALTVALTQRPGESATRSTRVGFPRDFLFNPLFAAAGCRRAQEEAGACPEESRIGRARAETALGTFAGPIHFADDFRLLVFLRGFGGLANEKLVGYLLVRPDGGYDTVFDAMPDVAATYTELSLEGGPRALALTPRRCGRYALHGRFASHRGEEASPQAEVEITGCAPTIRRARIKPRRFRAGKGEAVLSWDLSQAAGTAIDLQRLKRVRQGGRRWRRVGSLAAEGRPGANDLPFDGRLAGRPLRPGAYRFVLTAADAGGRSRPRRVPFRMVR